ncbi:hypothetical protein J0X19_11650 [Hymenobacter sp. BT186]|uniref:Uncharacterized protein n=1 Tax=Hymenobacter telluris TaxID=2816474 RepID=A0A939JDQ7_9BACT|nr:hypothetical protein [Hymenobacter telluris]MBO0358602.1 hypothetical protein [Hymenobacter telluris]MBW3374628.1 hypothetical protein [Hymenobacter norwichensis]
MSDETVDKNTKLLFNIGYLLSQEPDTNAVLKKMIAKAHTDIEKHALSAGKQQFTKDAIEGQDITPKRERTESEVLDEYYRGMDEAYNRGDFPDTPAADFKEQIKEAAAPRTPEPEKTEDRADPPGKPPGWQKMVDDMMRAAEERQKNKDNDRER